MTAGRQVEVVLLCLLPVDTTASQSAQCKATHLSSGYAITACWKRGLKMWKEGHLCDLIWNESP